MAGSDFASGGGYISPASLKRSGSFFAASAKNLSVNLVKTSYGLGGDIMPQIDLLSILAIFLAIGAVYILGMLLVLPIKLIVRLVINGVIGALALIVFNVFGSYIGVTIGVNPITALIAGFLGIPGVLLMIFVKIIL